MESEARSTEGIALLPCPFCGSHAKTSTEYRSIEIGWADGLGSPGRHTTTHHRVKCENSKCMAEVHDNTPEKAAECWNKRIAPEPDGSQAEICTVTVKDGFPVGCSLKAPGLPDGDHDLFCVPFPADMDPLPYREEIQQVCEDAMHSHGDYEGALRSIYGITQRCLFPTKSAQPDAHNPEKGEKHA